MASAGVRRRVLVLTLGEVGPSMAGIAIRGCELARALAEHADVTLAAARIKGPTADLGVRVVPFDRHDARTLAPHLDGVDAVVAQPPWPLVARALRRSGARLVYDLSGPEPLEALETHAGRPALRRRAASALTVDRLADALRDGHHFLASTRRQVDLWVGAMLGERLLTPAGYDADPGLASRVALVPHGLPDEPPRRSNGHGLRDRIRAIGDGDEVVLWNSAIWRWLDAGTAIRGVALLAARRPRVRLVVMSRANQPEHVSPLGAARRLAAELGILDRHVFFHDGWVPYAERASWLLDADCALACHEQHLETRFSFRTRYLDCLWAGLPLVCTEGDVLADRVDREGLGLTVPARDPQAVADALDAVLIRGRAAYAEPLARAAADYTWSRAARPLIEILLGPAPAAPLGDGVPRRPGHTLRSAAYSTAKTALNAAGIREWPRL
jgi:glycosyltransferase involved in cell wall biosynthesis